MIGETFYAVMRAASRLCAEAAGRLAPEARARHPELPSAENHWGW